MIDVLLGQSYFLRFDAKLYRAMQPYPPLGSLYAAAWLRQRGFSVGFFDAMLADSEVEWSVALDRHRPRFAVLFEDNFNYLSKMCLLRMRQAAFSMIAAARARGATVVVSGSDASDHAQRYLDQGADFVINGEGEETLGELLERLRESAGSPRDLQGLTFREGEQLVATPRRAVLRDLDSIPFPAWDLVDIESYRQHWLDRHGRFSMNIVATRGCPYHCNWCAKPIWGQTYHLRSPENVVAEIEELLATYHPDHLWFADDILGLKKGWFEGLADLLEQRRLRISFKCLSRADLLLRDGEIEALARAGCEVVWIGAESGSQAILDAMEKGTRVEQITEATRRLQAAGVKVGWFLQFGYPGESRERIEATRRLVREGRPDEIGMSVSYPLPGTRFFERVEAELGAKRNWVDSEDFDMMYRGPFSTAFYRRLYVVVQKEFRRDLGVREIARVLRRPASLRPGHLRRAAAVLWHTLTLPGERWRLERRARDPHRGIDPITPQMSHDEAAQPTPQAPSP